MDDKFLHDFRRQPSPEFARRLKASLDARDSASAANGYGDLANGDLANGGAANGGAANGYDRANGHGDRANEYLGRANDYAGRANALAARGTKWAALAASVVIVGVAFTFPSVRAGAQAFLDLFRVAGVVGVPFDAAQLSSLDLTELDLQRMLEGRFELLTEPGPPQSFDSPEEASAAAGISVMEPTWMPVGFERETFHVSGEYQARGVVPIEALELVMSQLGIVDVAMPVGLEGQTITVRIPPVVHAAYVDGDRRLALVQARSPEVAFPAGADIAALAEIGLRILGLDAAEARGLAGSIDWRSTLIVPVPISDASFRAVNVAGSEGLLIEPQDRDGSTLLWAADDRVFALNAPLDSSAMLTIAESLR